MISRASPSLDIPRNRDGQIVGEALLAAADRLQVRDYVLAKIIGRDPSSVSRLRHGSYDLEPGTKPFELAVLFVRMLDRPLSYRCREVFQRAPLAFLARRRTNPLASVGLSQTLTAIRPPGRSVRLILHKACSGSGT